MTRKKSQKRLGKGHSSSNENPFNVKINRSKHSILGQKVKGTQGLPGVSHSVGNARRKEEFHKKRLQSQKANKFVDRRLMDSSLSFEEQASLRLVEERKKKFKKNIFNLNEEESLTHKGVSLEYQKSFNETLNDSDEEEHLDPNFVKHAHFGGFTLDSSAPKSRKEIIDELIDESKKRKIERKMIKEKNEYLIDKLDEEWRQKHKSLFSIEGKKKCVTTKKDAFDILIDELKSESKAIPSGPVKTAEEIAREENEKIKKLEESQYKRMMNPLDSNETKINLLSADSIYDGLDIQFEPIDEEENINTNINASGFENDESHPDSSNDSAADDELTNIEDNGNKSAYVSAHSDSDVPDSIEKFQNIIDNHNEELHVIVENILKHKIKSRSKQNLEMLENFFAVLLEYIMTSANASKNFDILNDILPHLYALAEFSPVETAKTVLDLLDEEQQLFQQSKGKKLKKQFPRFQSLVLFKVISVIYSVSDFKHSVVTPAIVYMCDILSSAYSVTFQNTVVRLFISKIIYDCVSFSKRYVPEVFWFLNKTLQLATDNNKRLNLFVDEVVKKEQKIEIDFDKKDKSCNNVLKVNMIFEIIELLHRFSSLYEQLQCYKEIFSDSLNISKRLPTENYPNFLKESISVFIVHIDKVKNIYKPLTFENKKPVPLKLFEPAFESKFTRKRDDIPKKRKLVKSVNQKIRKEEKCLLREVRRNTQVIASEKLKERLEADNERKRKVKQLYQELAMQEGEYKKFVKKK